MMNYETLHDKVRESLLDAWIKTPLGKLYHSLEDYDDTGKELRLARVLQWLRSDRDEFTNDNWDEELIEWVESLDEQADPYAYYGVRRSDF